MSHRLNFLAGFSLVEEMLALGVAAFCLIALIGLLPLGLQTNQSAISQTMAASILSGVAADLRATPSASLTSPQYDITFGTPRYLLIDEDGRAGSLTDPNASRYRVTVTFPTRPAGAFAPTFVSLKVSWPASIDPATATPAGYAETFVAFDRY